MPDLTIPDADGATLKAYLARPAVGNGPWPGVVVIHDAIGLTVVTREHADRLSAAGYLALVPDLYTRGGMVRCVKSTFAALVSGTGVAFNDLDAARRWLDAQSACTGRIGVIGFCMGGGFALMTAQRGFSVAAPNYGHLPTDLSVPGVGHSFLDRYDLGPFTPILRVAGFGYDHPTAEDAWARILRFFTDHLQPAPRA